MMYEEQDQARKSEADPGQGTLSASAGHTFPPGGLVDMSRVAYQRTPLATQEIWAGILVLRGAGGNVTAISGSRGCAVVDTGYGPRVDEIARSIALRVHEAPNWLINTHWHFDHTPGNAAFASAGATIAAHTNCRVRLAHDQFVPSLQWGAPASPRIAWPVITFDGPVTFDLGSEQLRMLPQEPAHTDGDLAVFLPAANVLVMGDLFTNGSYPVIDESSGGSLRGLIEAVERLIPVVNADTAVVPGHGEVADRQNLVGFHDMLCTIEGCILALAVSEIIASPPTAEFDQVWGQGYVTGAHFTRMILAALGVEEEPILEHAAA
jgi:cyclase